MSTSRVLRNVSSNYLTYGLNVAVAFFLTPLLLRGLGKRDFALLVLAQAIYAVLGCLDLGLLVGVIRFVTDARERNEEAAIRATVSTAFYGLGALGVIVSSLLWLASGQVVVLFDLPSDTIGLAARALRVASAGLGLELASLVMTSYMQAHHEFHLPNIAETAVRLLRAAAIAFVVWHGYGLMAVVAVAPVAAFARLLGSLLMTRFTSYPLLPRLRDVRFASLRGLGRFSLLTFLDDNVNRAFLQADALLGARILALPQLTVIGAVRPIPGLLPQVSRQALTVAYPMVVAAEARNRREARARFLTIATRNWLLVSAVFVVVLWIWGEPLLNLWLGHEMIVGGSVLRVLLLAALAASFVYIPSTLLYGIGRVGYCTVVTLATTAVGLGLGAWGGWRSGPVGLAWGLVVAQSAAAVLLYAGAFRWGEVQAGRVFTKAVLPPVPAILVAALCSTLLFAVVPHTWGGLVASSIGTGACSACVFLLQMKRPERDWGATIRALIMEN